MVSLSILDRMSNWKERFNPRLSMSFTSTKGLLNAPGQNNCFLNSAVQVLWHLDVFRRSFRLLSGHSCMGNSCIFCALKVIFTQFQYSDQSALPPDALRKALAKTFADQQRFQLSLMDDAAECFENILLQIHFHIANAESEDMCNAQHCIPHQKFAMTVVEQIVCRCGATSEPLPFTQMVNYVSANALTSQAKAIQVQGSHTSARDLFAQLIRNAIAEGDIRECPSNCGKRVLIQRSLMNCPDVVSIGLVWDSDHPNLDHIKDVVRCIGTFIRLPELFHSVVDDRSATTSTLQLIGVVCYYGKHYSTFFFHSKMKKWIYFDDATVKEMGSNWQCVVDKCCRGHYQPLLLLYGNPNYTPITTKTAPDVTTLMPGQRFFNSPSVENSGFIGNRHRQISHELTGVASNNHSLQQMDIIPDKYCRAMSPNPIQTSPNPVPQPRRAMTPNPIQTSSYPVQPRRAITPGPSWGKYDSDEEDLPRRKIETGHCRQSSYLQAVNCPGQIRDTTLRLQDTSLHEESSSSVDAFDFADLKHRPLQNLSPHLTKVPHHFMKAGYNKPISRQTENVYPSLKHSLQPTHTLCSNEPIQHQNRITQISGDIAGFVSSFSAKKANASSVAKVNEIEKVNANVKKDKGLTRTDVVHSLTSGPAPVGEYSIKRTTSLEGMYEETDFTRNGRPCVSRSRPQSARPYDYGNKRPFVVPQMEGKKITQKPSVNSYVSQRSDFGIHMDGRDGEPLCRPSHGEEHSNLRELIGEDPNATYISRNTVENILKYQKVQACRPCPGGMQVGGSKCNRNFSLESCGREIPPGAAASTVNVDTPDNVSLGSHKDSGYRSGSSGGDRNSASSISTASFDSPTIDSLRAYGLKDASKSLFFGGGMDRKPHSPETPTSLQSKHSYSTLKCEQNKLGWIPEKQLRGRRSPTVTATCNSGEHCKDLCMRAEGLMEKSAGKEKAGDLAMALVYCTQAVGLLQQTLNMINVDQETKVHARMKHNACVLRSRSLHRRILTRQDSGTASDDHTSLSSLSTESDPKDVDLIQLEAAPKDRYQLLREQLDGLYQCDQLSRGNDGDRGLPIHPMSIQQVTNNYIGRPPPSINSHVLPSQHGVELSHQDTSGTYKIPNQLNYTQPASDSGYNHHSNKESAVAPQCRKQRIGSDSGIGSDSTWDNTCAKQRAKTVEIYGTLPRKKGSQHTFSPVNMGRDSSVSHTYFPKQRDVGTGQRSSRGNIFESEPPKQEPTYMDVKTYFEKNALSDNNKQSFPLQVNHQRQNSGSSLSKEEIKNILIHDYIKQRHSRPKPDLKPKPKLKPKSEKDTEHTEIQQTASSINKFVTKTEVNNKGSSSVNIIKPGVPKPIFGITQCVPQTTHNSSQNYVHNSATPRNKLQSYGPKGAAGSYQLQTFISDQWHAPNDSQECEQHGKSVTSSTNALGPHRQEANITSYNQEENRENSLGQMHCGFTPIHHQEHAYYPPMHDHQSSFPIQPHPDLHPNITDRRSHYHPALSPVQTRNEEHHVMLPKSSIIGKLDKIHQKQMETFSAQKKWMAVNSQHLTHTDKHVSRQWQAAGIDLKRSSSQGHLPVYDTGQMEKGSLAPPGGDDQSTGEYAEDSDKFLHSVPLSDVEVSHCDVLDKLLHQPTQEEMSMKVEANGCSTTSNDDCSNILTQAGVVRSYILRYNGDGFIEKDTSVNGGDGLDPKMNTVLSKSLPLKSSDNRCRISSGDKKLQTFCVTSMPLPVNENVSIDQESDYSQNMGSQRDAAPLDIADNSFQFQPDPTRSEEVNTGGRMQDNKKPKTFSSKNVSSQRKVGPRKSVSFCDNIALIGSIEDPLATIDYMSYLSDLVEHKEKFNTASANRTPFSVLPKNKTEESDYSGGSASCDPPNTCTLSGYDSDFEVETDDSASSGDNEHCKVKCNLCRKKLICMEEVYCKDCSFYMSKFQPPQSCHNPSLP